MQVTANEHTKCAYSGVNLNELLIQTVPTVLRIMTELEVIEKAWQQHIQNLRPPREAQDRIDRREYIYASARRKCLRRMVLEATHPSYFPDFDVDAKARFIRGEQREVDLRQALERVGQLCIPSFTVIGQQERIVIESRGRTVIRGKIDGKLKWQSRVEWPFEIKSWSPFLTDKIFAFEDLMRSPYTWSGAHQLLSYLYAMEQPFGLLVLDRPGLPRLIQVDLESNIEKMEAFLQDATKCVDHIEARTIPDYIDDPSECKRCPVLGSHCNPPMHFAGASIVTDEDTIARTERYAELQAMPELEEFDALDKWKKERFRGITQAVCGKCLVTGKPRKTTKLVFPDEETKKKYQVSDPTGGWNVTVTKVSE